MLTPNAAIDEREGKMRTFALSALAALAISVLAPVSVWAWSTEQASPSTAESANLADPDEALKALQDKVNSKNGSTQSGFYFSGGVGQQTPYSPYRFSPNQTDPNAPYSPIPGFRGQN
jgi:hypothetical protein